MFFSRWQKRNESVQNYVWILAAIIAFAVTMRFQARGAEQMGAIAIVVYFVLRFLLGFALNAFLANSIVGLLKFDYQAIEQEFRLLFQRQSILFDYQAGKDAYRYLFPGHELTMTVEPHVLPVKSGKQKTVAKVTIQQLNDRNRAFADQLTAAIDEMAKQLKNDSDKG